jgi:hypothetical protein
VRDLRPKTIFAITASLALARFLEEHRLVTRNLVENGGCKSGKDFELRSSDLTEQGMKVIRSGLRAWEKKAVRQQTSARLSEPTKRSPACESRRNANRCNRSLLEPA